MYCGEAEGQRLFGGKEMANIGARIILASGALTSWVKRFSVFGEFLLFDSYCIVRCF